jgi:hypothetical protein
MGLPTNQETTMFLEYLFKTSVCYAIQSWNYLQLAACEVRLAYLRVRIDIFLALRGF